MEAGKQGGAQRTCLYLFIGGGAVAFLALMVFFGGSERDPSWVWALFLICFFGGLATSAAGMLGLIVLALASKR